MQQDNNKIQWIEIFRGIGCTLVFFAHSLKTFHNIDTFFGKMGVSILFILSGMLTHKGLKFLFDEKIKVNKMFLFYLKRIVRIMPLYLISLIPFCFVYKLTFVDFVKHALLINATKHYWTIPVELLFYLIAPLFVLFEKFICKKNIKLTSIIFFVLCFVLWICGFHFKLFGENSLLFWLPLFIEGFIVDIVNIPENKPSKSNNGLLMALLFVGAFGFLYNQWYGNIIEPNEIGTIFVEAHEYIYSYVLFGLICTFTFIALKNKESNIHKIIDKFSLLKWIGSISFPLYLFHISIIMAIRNIDGYYNYTGNRIWETICAFLLSLAISAFFHNYVEIPFEIINKKLNKWMNK